VKRCIRCGEVKAPDLFREITWRKPSGHIGRGRLARCKLCETRARNSRAKAQRRRGETKKRARNYQRERRVTAERQCRRYRSRNEMGVTRAERRAQSDLRLRRRQLLGVLRALLAIACNREGRKVGSVLWTARYRTNDSFRRQQIARTWSRKERAGNLRTDARQARIVDSDGTLPPVVVAELFAATKVCPYCCRALAPREKTLDHIIPVSRGGSHSLGNVRVCCRSCNSSKRDRTLLEWASSKSAPRPPGDHCNVQGTGSRPECADNR